MNVEIIGFLAGSLVAVSLVPQILKSFKTRKMDDVSLGWLSVNIAGQLCWLVYGFAIRKLALIIMSAVTMLLALTVLGMKLAFKPSRKNSV